MERFSGERVQQFGAQCWQQYFKKIGRELFQAIEDANPESPIEELMLYALAFAESPVFFTPQPEGHGFAEQPCRFEIRKPGSFDEAEFRERYPSEGVAVYPQQQIGDYRVDFLIVAKFHEAGEPLFRYVVECDGHDYHERTKEQAQRDKSRDRALQAQGYKVIRFTGSEIWKNPGKCAEEVKDLIWTDEFHARPYYQEFKASLKNPAAA